MKLEWLRRTLIVGIWFTWIIMALILFLSSEEILILPTLFIVVGLHEVIAFFFERIRLWVMLRTLLWCICLALFSYMSTEDSQAKLFFPILCAAIALYMLLRPFKSPQIYAILFLPTWLICIALIFYFGVWPIGLISIGIALLSSIAISFKLQKEAQANQKVQQPAQEARQQEEQVSSPWPAFQIPGQQYQSLLPEYDKSFGTYIQNLPPDR